MLCNITNKMITMESLKYLKKIVPPLTIIRANTEVEIRKVKNKEKEDKPINMLTRTPN